MVERVIEAPTAAVHWRWLATGALTMGLAITLMHYAGMAATNFLVPTGQQTAAPLGGVALDGMLVGASITGAAVLILGMAFFAAGKEQQRQARNPSEFFEG